MRLRIEVHLLELASIQGQPQPSGCQVDAFAKRIERRHRDGVAARAQVSAEGLPAEVGMVHHVGG